MFVHNRRHLAALCMLITGISIVLASTLSAADTGACALLSPADIIKATNIMVGNGTAGAAVPGTLGKCTWAGSGDTKVIVTLTDAAHMELTVKAQQSTGADVPGLGSKAVGVKGAAFTGGGYIVSVVDSKGGFGVSILGKEGTRDRAIALAKIIESRR